jgi:hypothetical protein
VPQRFRTVPPIDFLTTFPAWLASQNGAQPPGFPPPLQPVPAPPERYISNLRDLATYVHFDRLYEQYLYACLILVNLLPAAVPFDEGNPYLTLRSMSLTQEGFGTFGQPHILTLFAEVGARALRAVWFQKWGVHRRLRPEEFGGRIEVHLRGVPAAWPCPAVPAGRYPVIDPPAPNQSEILTSLRPSGGLSPFFPGGGSPIFPSYLLSQAYAEGSPNHPSYGAGHATVAGACCTILKAFFDESFEIPNPVVPDPASAFTTLIPYVAPPGEPPLTVGGELNKLAANISLGRNAAGVHYRSDYFESVRLGEEIAIRLLQEQKVLFSEEHFFSLTRFDGTKIMI